nr:MAG TPA: Tape measure domain protein [Caudoviricetes sp.]
MAGGNLGDLWFQLGVKDNTSKELQKIIDKLKTGDDAANSLLRALQGFGTKKSGFKEQAEKAKEFADVLNEINRRISKLKKNDKSDEAKDLQMAVKNALSYLDMLQRINIERSKISELRSLNPNVDTSKLKEAELMLENVNNQLYRLQNKAQGGGGGGVDYANVLQDYAKVLQMTFRDVKQITDQFKKENPLSAFSGGAAKVEADISRVTEKLAKMRDLMAEGSLKGYNTNMLGGSITGLDNILARLQSASGNKSILTDAAQMKNLLSDVAVEMTKATAATQAYGREKGKAIAVEREFAAAAKLSAKDNDAELKAQSDYIKRYMALVEKKREIAEKAGISPFFKNDQGLKNIKAEIDTLLERLGKVRGDITLYQNAIGTGTKEGVSFGQQGLKEANAEAEKLMGTITALQNVYDTLRVSQANVKDLIGQTPQKQRQDDIQKRMSEYYSNLEKTSKEKEAQATRDAAKAKREDIAAEKQRQREINITLNRVQSLSYAMEKLQSAVAEGKRLNIDTSRAEAKIRELGQEIQTLNIMNSNLKGKDWRSYLGDVGQVGNGRSVKEANHLATELASVNRETQRGIELERKRQQEIAQTAAKVQSDLVRGFERANSHAGKLNSTVQDLKSLFLQGGLVFGAQQFAMSIITTGGEMEKQHIALQSILGDMQNANTMFNQIKELALNSPFTFSELNRDVKQLAAYGVEYDQLYDTTKRLADMSSGLGVSFDRIALAFGQVQARGWLDGKELRQIAYAGIPLLNKLSEFYSKQEGRNVSTSEIKTRISNREVSFDDVKSIFWQMTDAGGQFYNMQQVLSETLLGRYNKLKDAWEIMLAEFASGNSLVGGFFKTALDGATALVQALHTLAPLFAAAFSGYALTKLSRMAGGNAGSAYLSTKGKLAVDAAAKIAEGKQLNSVERQVLATKNQITGADLRNLIANKAINKVELQRLLVAGKISTKQYQIYAALLRQQGAATSLNAKTVTYGLSWMRVGVSAKLALNGIATAASSMWAAIGGLPGLIITGATMLIAKLWGDYTELTSAIKQTNEELVDRQKQMNEFRGSNDIKSIISGGDSKEIDNAISAYEEKLKELAPYEADLFIMSANERASHEERLKYLEEQLKLMQEANKVVQSKLADRDNYSDLQDLFDSARKKAEQYTLAKDKLMSFVPDKTESDTNNFLDKKNLERWVNNSMQQLDSASRKISEKISEMYKGIKAPKAEIESMQKQTIDSFVSGLSLPEEQMKDLRLSIYKGLGLLNGALKSELGQKLAESVSNSMPEVANAIRSGRELDEASKNKVKEIAKKCIEQMKTEYPGFANELQGLLNASNFQAVIKLVYSSDSFKKFTEAEQSLYDQYIPAPERTGSGKKDKRFSDFLNSIGGIGKNSNEKDLNDAAYQKLQKLWEVAEAAKVGKYTKEVKDKRMKAYLAQKSLTEEILGIKFVPSYNKSNKPYKPGKNKGKQEDEQLKDLKTRISLYKKMYAEIKKYKELFGEGALGQLANDGEFESIFKNKNGFPISDYTNYETSIKQILGTIPSSTKDRKDFKNSEIANIQSENRKLLEDQRKEELSTLDRQLDIISEQYETYKKIYELTGNKKGSENIAFGGTVQFDTYKRFLEEQLDVAVKHDNVQSGLNLTTDEVKGMSLENVKDKYGEESRVYDIRKKLEDENNKIKKETIDLMANLIEKNATIAQQIEDENRKYERQLELIKGIEDPRMRDRAKAGATKTHNENVAKLQFEQFKQESDWVTIFDDLDRVSSATISSMITKIDDFSRTTGLSVEVVKQLRDALDKLRKEDIDRNPLPYIFGAVNQGNAIGGYLKGNLGAQYMNGKKYVPTAEQAKKMGIEWSAAGYSKNELESKQKGKYADSSYSINALAGKFKALESALDPVIGLFKAMGEEDSILGQITGGASNAVSSAANTVGAFNTLSTVKGLGFLEGAGPYAAAASAAFSLGGSLIKAFGADYSSYNKAKAEYENLTSIWDSLISKKTEYMNIHWGTEAANASKEAQEMLESEIKQTKVIAMKNFNSGASAGSHSIKVRDWKKRGWKEAAPEISKRYGVKFDNMTDILDIDYKVLQQIKKDYAELWANLDEDSRTYLDKLIEYGEKSEDMIESLTEKLTGNKYSDLVSAWGDAMATMSNTSDNLVDHFEENLRNVILKSMIENLYGEKIKALIEKTKKYGDPNGGTEKKLDAATGKVMSEYTNTEMDEIGKDLADVTKQIEASRDYLKRYYGWSDNSSSSLTNSVKGITEDTGDLIASYLNSIRLDVSVIREEQVKCMSESNEIAKSQLTQLNFISANTLRNAEAAERIERVFEEYSSNFNMVINGVKSIKVR